MPRSPVPFDGAPPDRLIPRGAHAATSLFHGVRLPFDQAKPRAPRYRCSDWKTSRMHATNPLGRPLSFPAAAHRVPLVRRHGPVLSCGRGRRAADYCTGRCQQRIGAGRMLALPLAIT